MRHRRRCHRDVPRDRFLSQRPSRKGSSLNHAPALVSDPSIPSVSQAIADTLLFGPIANRECQQKLRIATATTFSPHSDGRLALRKEERKGLLSGCRAPRPIERCQQKNSRHLARLSLDRVAQDHRCETKRGRLFGSGVEGHPRCGEHMKLALARTPRGDSRRALCRSSAITAYVFLIGLLLTQYTITGYDASAHMTEETHEADLRAERDLEVHRDLGVLRLHPAVGRLVRDAGSGGYDSAAAFQPATGTSRPRRRSSSTRSGKSWRDLRC